MAHDVFISYSSKDRAIAETAYSALKSAGIQCWMDKHNILPGEGHGGAIIRPQSKMQDCSFHLRKSCASGKNFNVISVTRVNHCRTTVTFAPGNFYPQSKHLSVKFNAVVERSRAERSVMKSKNRSHKSQTGRSQNWINREKSKFVTSTD